MTKDPYKESYHKSRDEEADIITDALSQRFRELTGETMSDNIRDMIWYAVRYR